MIKPVDCDIFALALFCCWAIHYQELARRIDENYLRSSVPRFPLVPQG